LKELVTQNNISILFLCTGNSCRSQIAEGLARKILPNYINIYSAGVEAHGINPNAIQTMSEINIDISKQTSKTIDLNDVNEYDLIITLCGDARDNCPVLKGKNKHIHWDLIDPAKLVGNEEYILSEFAKVRDKIIENMELLKKEIENHEIFS
tara:strand:- start:222 stop:677 length:456 start_codon:yes stop_codon:yes gene_type:complete